MKKILFVHFLALGILMVHTKKYSSPQENDFLHFQPKIMNKNLEALSESVKTQIQRLYKKACDIYEKPTRQRLSSILANNITIVKNDATLLFGKQNAIDFFIAADPFSDFTCDFRFILQSGTDAYPFVIAEISTYSPDGVLQNKQITISLLQRKKIQAYEIAALTYQLSPDQHNEVLDEYMSEKNIKPSGYFTAVGRDGIVNINSALDQYQITNQNNNTILPTSPIKFISKYIGSTTSQKQMGNLQENLVNISQDKQTYEGINQTENSSVGFDNLGSQAILKHNLFNAEASSIFTGALGSDEEDEPITQDQLNNLTQTALNFVEEYYYEDDGKPENPIDVLIDN